MSAIGDASEMVGTRDEDHERLAGVAATSEVDQHRRVAYRLKLLSFVERDWRMGKGHAEEDDTRSN